MKKKKECFILFFFLIRFVFWTKEILQKGLRRDWKWKQENKPICKVEKIGGTKESGKNYCYGVIVDMSLLPRFVLKCTAFFFNFLCLERCQQQNGNYFLYWKESENLDDEKKGRNWTTQEIDGKKKTKKLLAENRKKFIEGEKKREEKEKGEDVNVNADRSWNLRQNVLFSFWEIYEYFSPSFCPSCFLPYFPSLLWPKCIRGWKKNKGWHSRRTNFQKNAVKVFFRFVWYPKKKIIFFELII